MTNHPDLFAALAAPFDPSEIKHRTQAGRDLHYITARTVMNRLDTILGPECWWDSYRPGGDSSVICRLTIVLPDGRELTKEDAGGSAGMADAGDDDKSAVSDAFKRAAVKLGVGRYLYRDGVPVFVPAATTAEAAPSVQAHTPDLTNGKSTPNGHRKERHDWPGASLPQVPITRTAPHANGGPAPRTGKALFAWCKSVEEREGAGLFRYLSEWARAQEYPSRMMAWDHDMVALGYAEACRKLAAAESQEGPQS